MSKPRYAEVRKESFKHFMDEYAHPITKKDYGDSIEYYDTRLPYYICREFHKGRGARKYYEICVNIPDDTEVSF